MKKYLFLLACIFLSNKLFASEGSLTPQKLLPQGASDTFFNPVFDSAISIHPDGTTPPQRPRGISIIQEYGQIHRLQHGASGDIPQSARRNSSQTSYPSYPMNRPGREWNDPVSRANSDGLPESVQSIQQTEQKESNNSKRLSDSLHSTYSNRQIISPTQQPSPSQTFRSIRCMMYLSITLQITSTTLLLYHINNNNS